MLYPLSYGGGGPRVSDAVAAAAFTSLCAKASPTARDNAVEGVAGAQQGGHTDSPA